MCALAVSCSSRPIHGVFLPERELVSLWGPDGSAVFLDVSRLDATTDAEVAACLHRQIAVEGEVLQADRRGGEMTLVQVTGMYSEPIDAGPPAIHPKADQSVQSK